MENWAPNKKIDVLYEVIICLVYIIILLVLKMLGVSNLWGIPVFMISFVAIPQTIRRKKQIKKIGLLQNILGISIEEMRSIIDVGKYDLIEWKKDKIMITPKQMYLLEDSLDKKYFLKFGEEFDRQQKKQETY
ncbi:hypothetical protein [Enterococcus xiangfangensis]|uniref:hypothetical protein n=1 Tax=Enterococcus xiangfangensis TaxID=1296537 RepID=UPI003D1711F0|nr:hypothetical protein [Enterococcus asini]